MSLADAKSTESFGSALETFSVKWSKRDRNFKEWQNENSMEVCEECAQRIHDAIQAVRRQASSEATQEQLAIIERAHP